jgi:hypothetical protein
MRSGGGRKLRAMSTALPISPWRRLGISMCGSLISGGRSSRLTIGRSTLSSAARLDGARVAAVLAGASVGVGVVAAVEALRAAVPVVRRRAAVVPAVVLRVGVAVVVLLRVVVPAAPVVRVRVVVPAAPVVRARGVVVDLRAVLVVDRVRGVVAPPVRARGVVDAARVRVVAVVVDLRRGVAAALVAAEVFLPEVFLAGVFLRVGARLASDASSRGAFVVRVMVMVPPTEMSPTHWRLGRQRLGSRALDELRVVWSLFPVRGLLPNFGVLYPL